MSPLSLAPLSLSSPWQGALTADEGGETTSFSLHPTRTGQTVPTSATVPLLGLSITVADAAPEPVQLLDGAQRALVGLVEGARLMFDARVRGGRLVGHWWRRDAAGDVVAHGSLDAAAVAR
ncbi:MAG TPA: hypothetical protein DGD08_15210 [Gemmatimonas aurantiaca]|uniref:Uncharacterized protein n=2 Tax=Gemmatimonas aurantiaca TaxID=173480 RepID=C1A5L0_GEMAT|nr:hypothetical protein [Gemmatimonas aurantiaca]BAH37520.1 hypothetical protein GAU_0478 [Gemmatimonas aurantiaca T-27]HCT58552.1 hypothetical protein [Gemmatimonas aurantiaca]